MPPELGVLPSGHLHCFPTEGDSDAGDASGYAGIVKAFERHAGDGLFALAARKSDAGLPPSFAYWRVFASQYLGKRCHITQPALVEPDPIEPLTEADAAALLSSVPPMRGAEYLSPAVLADTWALLDDRVCEQILSHGGLAGLLERKAPQWHQVGRVCFHLAENKNDLEYPFAFMATYAPELSREGRVRHQPLNSALEEYAGARNKKALIGLLSPVHRASEASPLVQELVETGDLYHPLAWTPPEAYQFLKEVPLYERCGVLVRLPDWW